MATIHVHAGDFTNDEWDAIERALIIFAELGEIAHTNSPNDTISVAINGDEIPELLRLNGPALSAITKIEAQ